VTIVAKENTYRQFEDFVNIVKRLRKDCPWDRIQTHLSLRRCLLEETYEVLEVIDENNMNELKKELGDILLQVVFHSNIAEEANEFTLSDVIKSETEKLIERHPHVFGDVKAESSDEVKRNWEKLKKNEGRKSVIEGIPEELPALLKAYRMQEKASRVGFDWKNEKPVFEKILEEINELRANVDSGKEHRELEDELGDVLFSIVNYSRFLKVNPEDALRRTIKKFRERFQEIEKYAEENNKPLEEMTLDEMDVIWNRAKKKVI
jgi:MazG family protein